MPPSLWPIRPTRAASMSVLGRSLGEVAGGFREAAVVVAQHRDPAPGEIVGQHQERLVAHEGLVAVLRAGSGDQHRRREGARAGRQGQGPGQPHAGGAVEGHLLLSIRIGLHRNLRPARDLGGGAPCERQRQRLALGEVAHDRLAIRRQHAGETRVDLVEGEHHLGGIAGQAGDRHAHGELVRRVEQSDGAVGPGLHTQHQPQARLRQGDRTLPLAVEPRDHRALGNIASFQD
jgi:hypothetical protein